jgi:exosortase/archaeosortase family protein
MHTRAAFLQATPRWLPAAALAMEDAPRRRARREGVANDGGGRLSEAQKFGLRFLLFLILASVLAWVIAAPDRLHWAQRFLAGSAAWVARLLGSRNSVDGDQIRVGGLVMDINYECTGLYVILILFTFLIAYPASWRSRIAGAVIGVAGLTVVNVLRIVFLVGIAELFPDLFGYFHEYVWQGVFLILVIAYAMTWVEHVQ